LSQADRQRLRAIWEERKNKVLLLETELSELQRQLDAIDLKASASGVKSGGVLSEYASYRKKLDRSLASVTKKLSEAKEDFSKAEDRLKHEQE